MLLVALLGLLLAALVPLGNFTAQAVADGRPLAAGLQPSARQSSDAPEATVENVYTFVCSNEAPGHLVDYLIAQGHGDDTLFEVLGYLKGQSGGVISNEWYNQVAAARPGSEVFTATLINYSGLVGGIEIGGDGTISIPILEGGDYNGTPGYGTVPSQDGQFTFTYAQDAGHYILTHSKGAGGAATDYYAFAIAWRGAPASPTPSPSATYTHTATRTTTPTRTPTATPTKAPRRPVYLPLVVR
jgi:hypothetical protein